MPNITTFDPSKRYIFLDVYVTVKNGRRHKFDAILDTGAPMTEFSDEALYFTGLLEKPKDNVSLKPGLQTQKYGRAIIPHLEVCSQIMQNTDVYVSHFDKSWGIKALMGLDFLRRFRITIDYNRAEIVTEPLPDSHHP